MKRTCYICKENKDIELFYRDKNKNPAYGFACKRCKAEESRRRYRTPEGKAKLLLRHERILIQRRGYDKTEKGRARIKRRRDRNPEKIKASEKVRSAIRSGKLIRMPCINCGEKKSHGHHPDYSKPLEVIWLCVKCHSLEHQRLKNMTLLLKQNKN